MPRLLLALSLVFAALVLPAAQAEAQQVGIVALGASNTYGKGVARGSDYPSQLQAMLRAKGLDARVANAGINGDTTAGMLARLGSAVPAGTQVVILQRGGNISTIVSTLKARGIKVIVLDRIFAGMSPQHIQSDGQHLTAEGHRIIAARLLPQVAAAAGR
jgi:acyl-CoA thioesterase I